MSVAFRNAVIHWVASCGWVRDRDRGQCQVVRIYGLGYMCVISVSPAAIPLGAIRRHGNTTRIEGRLCESVDGY